MQQEAIDLIYGRWRSQILYAGVELGVFDGLTRDCFKQADTLASALCLSAPFLYRLLRALASLGVLIENDSRAFTTTSLGDLFRSDHPQTLRFRVLTAEGPEHYAIWKHLPALIRDGTQDGFVREFGMPAFQYAQTNERYRRTFDRGMTGHSTLQSELVVEALRDCDLSSVGTLCDVGGGHGHLLSALLADRPHLTGVLFDLPEVFDLAGELWPTKRGLQDRCAYASGNMFDEVPRADAYTLKMILHNWNDTECVKILSTLSRSAPPNARVFAIEHLIPSPREPHFSKLFDIHMLCWGSGRERTESEYAELLRGAGWTYDATWYPASRGLGVIEASLSAF